MREPVSQEENVFFSAGLTSFLNDMSLLLGFASFSFLHLSFFLFHELPGVTIPLRICFSPVPKQMAQKLRKLLSSDKTRELDCLRLALLYALRYDKHSNNDARGLVEILKGRGVNETKLRLLRQILSFAGAKGTGDSTTSDLLSADNVKSFTKKVIKGLKGVENIYTQHSPVMKEVVQELARGRLKASLYPYLGTVQLNERPREIIVFVVGGATYEESLAIHQLNQSLPTTQIVLGSSSVHNMSSFLEEVRQATTPPSKISSLNL